MTDEFEYRDADHTYWLGSRRLLSVTEVIKSCGLIYEYGAEAALERGKVVHRCCKLLVENNLNWDTVDERIVGYVQSYQKFIDHTGWAARAAEVSLHDPILGVAGTFDVDFASGWLFDLKSGVKAKWHKLQTAAYRQLNGGRGRRGALYLKENGELPKLEEHTDVSDWLGFLTCLNFCRVRETYGR